MKEGVKMADNSLDVRMKGYERVTRTYLTRRTPVIIRVDGKAFHTFTKGFEKPFDSVMVEAMQATMKYLCENIEGCVIGYTQSDEITLVLCDYKKLTSQAWFDDNVLKMCSISASMATMAFNKYFAELAQKWEDEEFSKIPIIGTEVADKAQEERWYNYSNAHNSSIVNGAMFDSRVFNIPKEEVCNCLLWRQQDATRNSIQAVAQSYFPHKQIQNKSNNVLQDKLFTEKGINWNDYPTHLKRGSCCVKKMVEVPTPNGETVSRLKWVIDKEIPIFSQEPAYINNRIIFE